MVCYIKTVIITEIKTPNNKGEKKYEEICMFRMRLCL